MTVTTIDNPELANSLLAAKALTKTITGTEAEIQDAYLMDI